MKLRRWICFLLCLVLTVCLCAPALADGELFFVAVNDTIPLTLSVFPTYSGGTLYVPYQVFDSQPCGVTPSYNQAKQTYVLLSRTRQMIFDLAAGTVSDESGSVSTANVLYRSGILYLPLTFCASHFGLKTTMLESAGGYQILRFTDGSEVYDDSLFVEKAENLIAYRVRQSQSGSQSPERPTDRPNSGSQGTQEPPAAEKKPATVYLAFTGSETMRASMAALETYKLHGTFFLTEAEILADPSLVFELLAAGHSIGITAGASTPAWIIKEVSNMMSDEIKIENGEDFAAMLEESFKTLNNGEKVTGTVVGISNNDVQVDLGVKHTAYIPLSELSDDPNYDVAANIHVGDEIEAVVVRVNDGEGTVTLSKKRVDQLKGWETVEKAYEEHTVVEGTIVEENRGGVVATAYGVRVFIPASQTGVPKDQPMSPLVKTKQSFYITEINRQRKRVVGSIRQIQQEARKAAAEQIWNTIEIGNEYDGVVKSLTSYGAFVDIGGVDGMVHISELSWGRIKHPSEVVSVGDKVKVFVIGLDKENKKISLGYKREEDNPWNVFKSKYDIGSVAEVKILKFMPFGAFAEIVPGVDGLIHISQIADHRIAKPEDALEVGQVVEAKIIDINDEKKKVSLSIRALLEDGEDYED